MNSKIPVIMYHEVSNINDSEGRRSLTPFYDISSSMFEEQLKWLAKNNYKTLLFDEAAGISCDGKYVALTFDDGFKGNYVNALPLLLKYGYKATFFIRVGAIGDDKYMNWDELKELIATGMAVESHTVSHRPLHTLTSNEILKELRESKAILEQGLGHQVTAISFPHGSYNQEILDMAHDEGYSVICTSETGKVFRKSFDAEPAIINRITMTTRLAIGRFIKSVKYDPLELFRQQFTKCLKNSVKRIIGINRYRMIYRALFGIKSPSK